MADHADARAAQGPDLSEANEPRTPHQKALRFMLERTHELREALDEADFDAVARLAHEGRALNPRHAMALEAISSPLAQVERLIAEGQNPDALEPFAEAIEAAHKARRFASPPRPTAISEIAEEPPAPILAPELCDAGALLVNGMVAVLAGSGGSGKSKLALQLALQVAGYPRKKEGPTRDGLWHLHAPGPVLYCTYEDRPGTTKERASELVERLEECPPDGPDFNPTQAIGGTYVLNLHGRPLFGVGETAHYNTRPQPLDGWDALAEGVAQLAPRLVVIDPVLAAFQCDQNTAAPVRASCAVLEELAAEAEGPCAVLLVAHSSKAGRGNNNSKPDLYDVGQVSGSAAWYDAARAVLVLGKTETAAGDAPALAIAKANYGKAFVQCELEADGWALLKALEYEGWRTKDQAKGKNPPENGDKTKEAKGGDKHR